ncbi:MAG: MFS transporter [Candidatus Dormibacteria bacterium]
MSSGGLFVDITPVRRSRDFRLLWLCQFVSWSGRQTVIVAMPYQVYVLTHSSFAVGLLGLIQVGPIIVAGLYGGAFADRFDRRRVQLVSKTVLAVASIALAIGAIHLQAPVWFVFVAAAICAGTWAIDQAARGATVPRLVSREMLPSAMSLIQITFQTASIGGPALCGLIIATAGVAWAYVFDAVAFIPVVALLWLQSPQPPVEGQHVSLGWQAPMDAIRYVRGHRLVVGLFSADLIAMVFGMPTAVFPALALTVFGYGPTGLGLLYAAPAAGALVGSVLSGWVRRVSRQGQAVFVAIAVWGLAIAAFGVTGHLLWLGLAFLAIAGAADLVSAIFRSTILQLSIPDSMRGRMSAFHSMVTGSGPRLGDLEAGAVAALVNPVFSVVSGGIACIVGIGLLAALIPEMWTQRASAQVPVPPPAMG